MSIRSNILFNISRRRLSKSETRTVDYEAYQEWRRESLSNSWNAFENVDIDGKNILDFGCGDGALSIFLAKNKTIASVIGIDIDSAAIDRAKSALTDASLPHSVKIEFRLGTTDGLPVPEKSVDLLIAFDCLEHVMSPLPVFCDWYRVLRPGGKCLLEWFPYKGPWGPHMESLIPVPWAHFLFGEKAMLRTAEQLYELPQFTPKHWDLDEHGNKKPNKWKQWSSFKEQGYLNELDLKTFRDLVKASGLEISRLEKTSFSGSPVRKIIGNLLTKIPIVGEYFIYYTTIELYRPK